ncbi:TonB-dependent receptor domain-containing protein [Pseudoxanthomonas taiwanensis]|uniref:TonB-dependent receptor n=1 Tax=Pseudoxanthomonas taiwanensis TaxID=176598 RepID=A0A921TGV7_9GAMM|nr:TonB-dependent receptor [Pseudoxanthomonas taiwanensis]KAF1684820.1 TonB-dependent receptor [Pseudoxanthomonas taiwanensis]
MSKPSRIGPPRSSLCLAVAAALAPPAWAQATTDQAASGQAVQLDSVQVRGEFIPEPMQQTAEVASFVTREDLQRTGDSDAAQALTRVSGLSLVGEKFVYVRGLGERYSSALFNGSPLPSPEPLQRVVPLDLFPSEVLQSVTVQKTYSARYPGEFGGGVIDLQGLTVPKEGFLKLSIGTGGNSATTGEKGLTYYGGDDDWWGYDDGTRKMSPELRQALATGRRVDLGADFDRADIRTIGRSINDPNLYLLQQKDSIDPDFSFGGSAGNSMEIQDGVELGFVAVANFSNQWRTRIGQQQDGYFTGDSVEFNSSYDFVSTRNNARVNAMFGAGLKTDRHQIGFTTLYVHDTLKQTRSRSGVDNLAGFQVRDDYTEWFERTLVNNQVSGTHRFGEYDDLTVEWRGAVSRANRESPYETGISYENVEGYWSHDASRVQNYIRFGEVEDEVASGGVDLKWRLPTEREFVLSGGASYSDNDRSAWQREFRFLALDGALPFYNRYQRIDYLFSDYNLSQDLLRLRETTGNTGAAAYDATLKVRAAYLQLEGEVVPMVRASLGVRYEDATQAVHPYDIFTGQRIESPAPLEEDYLLPAATVTWNFADNQQLRFGVSETIARPQFREMAPQQYNDPDNDRLFYGNPNLVDSKLRNFDLRYEWFFGAGEYLTAGLFHKEIDRPIEANVNEAGGVVFQSFVNAPSATVQGFEFDAKKYFDLPIQAAWWGDNRLYVAGNYTWSDSKVKAGESDTVHPYGYATPIPARLFVRDGSQLQGQSEHIANLQLGIESASSGFQATLVANHVSERILARGRPGQPDYMEKPGTTLDLVVRKGFDLWDRRGTLAFTARNLLETDHEEYQERGGRRVDVYTYEPGVSYSVSLSVDF